MPTILDLLQKSTELPLRGRSLFENQSDSQWFGMTSSGGFSEPNPGNFEYFEYGILSGNWKLRLRVDSELNESLFLYDLKNDQGEQANQAEAHPRVVSELYARLLPIIRSRTVIKSEPKQSVATPENKQAEPVWIQPSTSGTLGYNDLERKFKLEWRGTAGHKYIIEYVAGTGDKQLSGFLNVHGTTKDFGQISRRYWNTWIVPNSPYRLRVRKAGSDQWSQWIELVAEP
jgi:hypothetical protein